MNEIERFERLFAYHAWANERTAVSLESVPGETRAVKIFAHVAAASQIWQGRIEGDETTIEVWPDWSLAEGKRRVSGSVADLRRCLADRGVEELERIVEYRNSRGDAFSNTVREILDHLSLHYHYHRGQIAMLVSRAGGEPAATDYIFYLRE